VLPEGLEPSEGGYYEVKLRRGAKAEKLERKRDDITVGATKVDPETDAVSTVLFIPDASIPVLDQIFEDYATGNLTAKGEPQRKDYVDRIETIRRARLFSFWRMSARTSMTGLRTLPSAWSGQEWRCLAFAYSIQG
jgi:hypothetical protein